MRKTHRLGISTFLLCVLFGTMHVSANAAGQFDEQPESKFSDRTDPFLAGNRPASLSNAQWLGIRRQIEAQKYQAFEQDNGGFTSSNPAHGWQIQYEKSGTTRLSQRSAEAEPYQLGFRLQAYGYSSRQQLEAPALVRADRHQVTYQWNDNLSEWWVNSEEQLEQWFELKRRPPGSGSNVPLELEISINTGLQMAQTGQSLVFKSGSTRITYDKLKAWDANGSILPSEMHLNGEQLRLVIDDSSARYPITIDPSLQQQVYIKASNPDVSDFFATSMAYSGDTLVIGTPKESSAAKGVNGNQSDNSAFTSGAVYVFVREGDVWTQQAYIKASNTRGGDVFGNPGDHFGQSVAIDGDTLVVGAPKEQSKATGVNGSQSDDGIVLAGAAYVFVRNGTTWTQQAYLKPSNTIQLLSTGIFFEFGFSVALEGNTIAVGAIGEPSNATGINGNQSDTSKAYAGAVYVFTRNGSSWSQQAYIKASNSDANDRFGSAMDLSGSTLVVGAPNEFGGVAGINGNQSDNSSGFSGAVYVLTRNASSWSQQAYIKASNPGAADLFGGSLVIDGETLLVSAVQEDSKATGVNGDQSDDTVGQAGAVYAFVRNGSVWSQQAYLKGSNPGFNARFGSGLTLSGDLAFIGAPGEHGSSTGIDGLQDQAAPGAGAVYRFNRSGTGWSQTAYIKASNTDAGDGFGASLAMSGDSLAVGATTERSISPGVDADQQDNSTLSVGAVYVFSGITGTAPFNINAGLNDAWVSDDAPFQGMFITVYPNLKLIFVAWFTFDSVRPPPEDMAVFGATDQRWVTAVGQYLGNFAAMNVELTTGGAFNASVPLPMQDTQYGTMSIEFTSCSSAQVMYSFPGVGLSGTFSIHRVVPSNVALCEMLNAP